MTNTLYILGDADKVRERVEAALFAHDLPGLTAFSATMTKSISNIVYRMRDQFSATVIMSGGDDILFTASADNFDAKVLQKIVDDFCMETGCTISFGVGSTLEESYLNLRRAKATGGGIIRLGS